MKIKKILSLILLIIIINLSIITPSFANVEDPDEWNYIWLDEAIEEAQTIKEPSVLSRYAVVYDRASGTVIWGKDENTPVPMASTTKMMTAIVMMEIVGEEHLNDTVTVSKEAASTIGSRLGLNTGDKITYNDLLYGLMLCSGNDAAVEIAISTTGSVENFVELMNNKAKELGLQNTHFVTPHGLDRDGHYTTALELAKIVDYATKNKKVAEVVATKQHTVTINGYPKTISNTNELLGYLDGVTGGKTGYTSKAGRCLTTTVNRDGFEIITVVLGADTRKIRTQDTIKLIEYTYKEYKQVDIDALVQSEYENWCRINKRRIRVIKGVELRPEIYIEDGKYKMYPLKTNETIEIESTANTEFEAPLPKDTEVGKIIVYKGNEIIDEISIKTVEQVERKSIIAYLFEIAQLIQILI